MDLKLLDFTLSYASAGCIIVSFVIIIVIIVSFVLQEIGYTHMRVAEGVSSLLQMSGLLARLCSKPLGL